RDSERQGLLDQPGVDGSGGDDLPGPSAALFGLPAAAQLRLQAGVRQVAPCALSWARVASASAREITPNSLPSPVVMRLLVWMSWSRIDLSSSSSVTLGRKVLGPGRITCSAVAFGSP